MRRDGNGVRKPRAQAGDPAVHSPTLAATKRQNSVASAWTEGALVVPDLDEPGVADGHALAQAVVIPDSAGEGHLRVLYEREQQSLRHVARADDPGGDAVDAGIETIEADAHAARVPAPDDSLRDGLQFVGERDGVAAAGMALR